MKSIIGLITIAVLLTSTSVALAAPCPELELVPVELKVSGQLGDWFPLPQSESILCKLEREKKQGALLDVQQDLLKSRKEALDTALAVVDKTSELAKTEQARGDQLADRLRLTEKELQDERDRSNSIFRSPAFWAMGGALTTALVMSLVLGLSK